MARSFWGLTPRQSIELECARRGRPAVVAGCCALVRGSYVRGLDRSGTVDDALVLALGGPPAQRLVDGTAGTDQRYWLRVCGACFDDVGALRDDPVARVRAAAERAVVLLVEAGA